MFEKIVLNSKVKAYCFEEVNHELIDELIQNAALIFENDTANFSPDFLLEKIKARPNIYVYRLKYHDETYYLKRFRAPAWSNKVKNAIRLSKAFASLKKASQLIKCGFEVAEPVAALTYERNIFQKESLYIAKRFSGVTMQEFLEDSAIATETKKEVISNFFKQLSDFYSDAFMQKDPKPENFMISFQNDNRYRFAHIDLESIVHLTFGLKRTLFKNLKSIYRRFYPYNFDGCVAFSCNQVRQKLQLSRSEIKGVPRPRHKYKKMLKKYLSNMNSAR